MKLYSDQALAKILDQEIFHLIGDVADEMGVECYVVGGYVRDIFLERPSNDIDVVVVGSGIAVAEALKRNIGLVFSLVNQFCFNAQNEDIVQLAMVSLADALKKWDPKRGLKISTWVRNPIKWAILRAQGAYAKTGTIAEEIAAKNHRFGRKWSVVAMDAELAGKEGDGGETIANLITPTSVAPDYINAHSIKTREEEIHDNDVRSGVKELMDSMGDYLSKKEIKVIMGIFNGHSLAEIGVKMKLSRMRISQISRDAFAKIKKSPLGDRLHALVKAG